MMDDHFSTMLAPSAQGNAPSFLPSTVYQGSRPGYIFQMNSEGVGYYLDPMQNAAVDSNVDTAMIDTKKRKLEDMSTAGQKRGTSEKSAIDRLLEESDNVDVELLTSESLKKMLLGLEKKINRNQKLRMKFPDEPEKFMDSEVELHEELNNLYAVSASPELYSTLVKAGSAASLLGMVAHENTDVSLAAVGLLQELTDPETILENEEDTIGLVDALLEGQCLELVVQNLSRLDETCDEDSQGVHDSFSILENMLEIRPTLAQLMVQKTHILKFLLLRLKAKGFDPNKLFASELLSVLLQREAGVEGSRGLATVTGVDDPLDQLLQIISQYRKVDPDSPEEKECVQNLFLSLCTVLMDAACQAHFRQLEGVELMMRCLKENKYAASCACRAITYAVSNNRENCERVVSAGGFRYVFPLFMGRGFPSHCKKAMKREMESASASTVSQLCLQLHKVDEKDVSHRLLAKFAENDHEKTDRSVELFVQYHTQLLHSDRQTAQEIEHLTRVAERSGPEAEGAELALDVLEDPDAQYIKRMDAGLHLLQQVAVILAFIIVHNHTNTALILKIQNKLEMSECSIQVVQRVLREHAAHLDVSTSSGSSSSSSSDKQTSESMRQRQTLIEWSACMQHILQYSS